MASSGERRHRTVLALAAATLVSRAAVLAVLCAAYARWSPLARDLAGDVANWFLFAYDVHHGGVPFVDVRREYPVGAGLLYLLLVPFWREDAPLWHMVGWHGGLMAVADVVNTVLFFGLAREVAPRRAVLLTLLFSLNLTALLLGPVRFESCMVTLLLLGLRAARQGRPRAAAVALSLGAWLKWFPALLMPAAELQAERAAPAASPRESRLAAVGIFALVAIALNGPFLLLGWQRTGSIAGWLSTYRFHLNRDLYPDTVIGMAQLWWGPLPFERWASLWSLVLLAAALFWGARRGVEKSGVVACAAILALNRVYSPQFHLWFYPLLLLLAAEQEDPWWRRLLGLFVVLDVLNAASFPFAFHAAYAELGFDWKTVPAPRAGLWTAVLTAIVVARSVAVAALGVMVMRLPGRRAAA